MSGLLRDSDRFGRIGGDEFVILLYGTDEKETEAFFNRVAKCKFEVEVDGKTVVPISFSVGWVEWSEGIETVQEWLDKADEVMYGKKRHQQVLTAIDKAM